MWPNGVIHSEAYEWTEMKALTRPELALRASRTAEDSASEKGAEPRYVVEQGSPEEPSPPQLNPKLRFESIPTHGLPGVGHPHAAGGAHHGLGGRGPG